VVRHSVATLSMRFRKQLIGLVVIVAFAVVGIGLVVASRAATFSATREAEAGTLNRSDLTVTEPGASAGMAVKFGGGASTSTCNKGGSCTAAEVAVHNKQTDCWVIYDARVFNITAWVPIHDGGEAVYNSTTCGHDITEYLAGNASSAGESHDHSSEAYDTLETYYLATLK